MTGTALLPFDQTASQRQPRVFVQAGEVFADSRDVAAFFDKQHGHVLRDIDNMIRIEPDLKSREFTETTYRHSNSGLAANLNDLARRCYHMTRDGFILVAMGFTGAKALKLKRRFIEAFNVMEAELRERAEPAPAAINVRDQNQLAVIASQLVAYTAELQQVIEAKDRQIVHATAVIKEAAPKVEFYENFANADGLFTLTATAKILGVPPHTFTRELRGKYLFESKGVLQPYQRWINEDVFVLKTAYGHNGRGGYQTLVTPNGLQYLSKRFKSLSAPALPSVQVVSTAGLFRSNQASAP